ncbi:MAG: histidine kinase [Ginsengibacter sp.]
MLFTFIKKIIVTGKQFIFSKKISYKLLRHSAFWIVYYLHTIITSISDLKIKTVINPLLYKVAFYDALYFLPIYLISVYFSIYFILPRYLANRRISFLFLSLVFLLSVTATAGYFISRYLIVTSWEHWDQYDVISLTIMKCSPGQIIITGSAIILKIMKDYFLKQQENEILEIESIRNRLRLLKIHMHPRILFESLHIIYEDINAGTRHAPEMILKLSDLLSYLLYESEMKHVTLEKEIKMIENYMNLKKTEYKNGLNINIEMDEEICNHSIPPGIFLPLLEIGIAPPGKPGRDISVSITLRIKASTIYFSLINNTPGIEIMKMPSVQSSIESIKGRLNTADFQRVKMECNSAPGNFNMSLLVELKKTENLQIKYSQNSESLLYEHK